MAVLSLDGRHGAVRVSLRICDSESKACPEELALLGLWQLLQCIINAALGYKHSVSVHAGSLQTGQYFQQSSSYD